MEQRIVEYLPKARGLANHVWLRMGRTVDRDDLIGEAYLAVVEADRRYDASKAGYATFMSRRVVGALYDYMRGMDMATRTARKELGTEQIVVGFADEADEEDHRPKMSAIADTGMGVEQRLMVREVLGRPRLCRDRRILRRIVLDGERHGDVARAHGMAQSRVSQIYCGAVRGYRDGTAATGAASISSDAARGRAR